MWSRVKGLTALRRHSRAKALKGLRPHSGAKGLKALRRHSRARHSCISSHGHPSGAALPALTQVVVCQDQRHHGFHHGHSAW